jgi:hypothetical protein
MISFNIGIRGYPLVDVARFPTVAEVDFSFPLQQPIFNVLKLFGVVPVARENKLDQHQVNKAKADYYSQENVLKCPAHWCLALVASVHEIPKLGNRDL